MNGKFKQMRRFILYILFSNLIYGFVLYYSVTALARVSLVYAYVANLFFIVFGLLTDEYLLRSYASPKFVAKAKKEKNVEQNYKLMMLQLNSFVSFKTVLYLFYILVLVVSQITSFMPHFSSENLGNFLRTVDYSVILLLAYDEMRSQFSKDRDRVGSITEKFKRMWNQPQE